MKSLKERTEIQQAYLDGKKIQYWYDGRWLDCGDTEPGFTWQYDDYRIKPASPTVLCQALCKCSDGKYFIPDYLYANEDDVKKDLVEAFVRLLTENPIHLEVPE